VVTQNYIAMNIKKKLNDVDYVDNNIKIFNKYFSNKEFEYIVAE
jgi:hypothetical protein